MTVKIVKRNVKPSNEEINSYLATRGVNHIRNTNLRFGKIVIMSDQDLDG